MASSVSTPVFTVALRLTLLPLTFSDLAHVQASDIDAALDEFAVEDFLHLVELEIVVGVHRQHVFSLLDARVGALEIEACR